MDDEIHELINELKRFDNYQGYKLSYERVKNNLQPTIKKLIIEEKCLDYLHELIKDEETWSCLFALEVLQEIKSEKSIPYLIRFIEKNEESDNWDGCETAMLTLQAIGKPSIPWLMNAVEELFKKKEYLTYLVGALTEIKDDKVYSFMLEITRKYVENSEEYRDWLPIECLTWGFSEQQNKEILPLLRNILAMDHLSEMQTREIRDTVKILEDPEKFEEDLKQLCDRIKKEDHELKDGEVIKESTKKRKLGRNDSCHCGSGKKYKKCCLENDVDKHGRAIKI